MTASREVYSPSSGFKGYKYRVMSDGDSARIQKAHQGSSSYRTIKSMTQSEWDHLYVKHNLDSNDDPYTIARLARESSEEI